MMSSPYAETLRALFAVAVKAAHGRDVLARYAKVDGNVWIYRNAGHHIRVPLPNADGRLLVFGAGKAAASMAQGLQDSLGTRISAGLLIIKYGHTAPVSPIEILEAAHPTPDENGFAATQKLLRVLDQTEEKDTIFFVLSGGASALLVSPAAGLQWNDEARVSEQLVRCGASIDEINIVRKHISAVKGGRLRARAKTSKFCTLAISDVPGDDPSTIGSGPTVPDPSTFAEALAVMQRYNLGDTFPQAVRMHLERGANGLEPETPKPRRGEVLTDYHIIASNNLSIDAAAQAAREKGYDVRVVSRTMADNTHKAAEDFADALRAAAQKVHRTPVVLIAGGETTLTVLGTGRGGRNQEFAVIAARALKDCPNVLLLSAGTDGTDGPTDVAGAIIDGSTFDRARAAGMDVEAHLRNNDTYPVLAAIDALFRTGPTGTNVMDLVIGIAF